jgi:hypothetical protein
MNGFTQGHTPGALFGMKTDVSTCSHLIIYGWIPLLLCGHEIVNSRTMEHSGIWTICMCSNLPVCKVKQLYLVLKWIRYEGAYHFTSGIDFIMRSSVYSLLAVCVSFQMPVVLSCVYQLYDLPGRLWASILSFKCLQLSIWSDIKPYTRL